MSARSTRRKVLIATKPDPDELQQQMQKQQQQTTLLIRQSNSRSVAMGGTAIERSMISPGSIAIYNVTPVKSSNTKSTLFAVHVQNAISGRSWVVHRRYTDFLTLRELITAHFKLFSEEFPRLEELVSELYFPRKHKLRSKMGKVIEHRCEAFLEYLVALHRVLISQNYLPRKEVSDLGLSILRGFIGSSIVQDSAHREYMFHTPIRPSSMKPSDRVPVNQCGSLLTVLEEDAENDVTNDADGVDPTDKSIADESTDETDFDGSSCGSSSEDDAEDDASDRGSSLFRRHSKKYARTRRTLTFLKKDLAAESRASN